MEAIKQIIEEEIKRKNQVENELKIAQKQLDDILRTVHQFCIVLKDMDEAGVPTDCPSVEKFDWLLCLLKSKLESTSRKAVKLQEEHPIIDESLFRPDISATEKNQMWLLAQADISPGVLMDTKNKNLQVDEDEVPTRAFLKRQAQVIVDTKSRRKGFSRVTMPSRVPLKK